jgi:hypothetical protein
MYRVLFLLGAMRSGTTYFRNILSTNSNIQVLGSELNQFWTKTGKAPCGLVKNCPPMMDTDVTTEIETDVRHYFDQQYRMRNSPYKCLYRTYRRLRYGNESLIKSGNPYYLLNKSTHLLNKVPFIDRLFPEALYICIIRNPYAQAYSLYRHLMLLQETGWSMSYPTQPTGSCWSFRPCTTNTKPTPIMFHDIARYWVEQNTMLINALDNRAASRVIYIAYEDLVTKPNSTLDYLKDFLEMDRLNINFSRRPVNHFSHNPLNDWEKELTKEQIDGIETTLIKYSSEVEQIRNHLKLLA